MARADGWLKLAILAIVGYIVWRMMNGPSNPNATPLEKWAEAIQAFEGWFPGSTSFRNNNPGNLKYAGQSGATGQDNNGFAVFPDYQTGFQALVKQLQLYVSRNPDYTLTQQMSVYLGGSPFDPKASSQGNPLTYAAFIASKLGASVSDTLGQLFGGGNG